MSIPFNMSFRFFHIFYLTPLHLSEQLFCRFPKAFRSHFFCIVAYKYHGPYRLGNAGDHSKKQRPQNPATLVTVYSIPVFLASNKAKTTKTVRALYPSHRQRRCADKFSLGGYLPIGRLTGQPKRTQSGHRPASDLLLVDGIANSQTLAALGTTAAKNGATPTVFHASKKTMLVYTLTIVRLESSFHFYNL